MDNRTLHLDPVGPEDLPENKAREVAPGEWEYRGYKISYRRSCVPSCDYQFHHDDYDGAPDSGDSRCGTAATLPRACYLIDDQIAEEE